MNTLDWLPLYLDLWEGESVKRLSLGAQGAYLRILVLQFRESTIPSDMKLLALLIGADRQDLESVWPEIGGKFVDLGDGRLMNLRMDAVRREQEQKMNLAVSSGKRGAEKRWGNSKSEDRPPNRDPIRPPNGEVNRPPNATLIAIDKNRIDKNTSAKAGEKNSSPTPYQEIESVLIQVADKTGWTKPVATDVRKFLKEDSPIRVLLSEGSVDETVRLFVFAFEHWNNPPTWSSVCSQRNQLRDQMSGRSNGVHKTEHSMIPGKLAVKGERAQ